MKTWKRGTWKKEEKIWNWRNRRNKNIPPLPLPATRIVRLARLEAIISWIPRWHKIPDTFATSDHPLLCVLYLLQLHQWGNSNEYNYIHFTWKSKKNMNLLPKSPYKSRVISANNKLTFFFPVNRIWQSMKTLLRRQFAQNVKPNFLPKTENCLSAATNFVQLKRYGWRDVKVLTLKAPRKTASENVVCLCCLLNILADFSNLFLHTGKECGS